jgi:hypothetical protein
MVNSEFEKIMLEQTFDINRKLSETCERLSKVETKIDNAMQTKVEKEAVKYNRLMAVIGGIGAFSGLSWVWNLAHPR